MQVKPQYSAIVTAGGTEPLAKRFANFPEASAQIRDADRHIANSIDSITQAPEATPA